MRPDSSGSGRNGNELQYGVETGLQGPENQAGTRFPGNGRLRERKAWTWRRAGAWLVLVVAGFALACWLRYGVIQPQEIGIACGPRGVLPPQ